MTSEEKPKRVILVHGIREHGRWFTEVENAMLAKGVQPERVGFEYLNVFGFITRGAARAKAEAKVLKGIRRVFTDNPDDDIAIIAFSFGTHATMKALAQEKTYRPSLIIFSGAVASIEENDWPEMAARTKRRLLLNEVGTKDPWPVVAKALGAGYGHAGSLAANEPGVRNRFHDASHSPNYKKANGERVYEEWARIIGEGATPAPSDPQKNNPFWFGGIQPTIRYVLPVGILSALALMFFHQQIERSLGAKIPFWAETTMTLRVVDDFRTSACVNGELAGGRTTATTYAFNHYIEHFDASWDHATEAPSADVMGQRIQRMYWDGRFIYRIHVDGHRADVVWTHVPSDISPGTFELRARQHQLDSVTFQALLPEGVHLAEDRFPADLLDVDGRATLIGDVARVYCDPTEDGAVCLFDELPDGRLPAGNGVAIYFILEGCEAASVE